MTDHREQLLQFLALERAHVIRSVEGLSDEQTLRSLLPSGWSCAGLIRHLALDVEAYWFQCTMRGDDIADLVARTGPDDGWSVPAATSPHDIIDLYRAECATADAIIATYDLDDTPAWIDPRWGGWSPPNLHYLLLHVITETACHAGHLDAARELIDGHQNLVLA